MGDDIRRMRTGIPDTHFVFVSLFRQFVLVEAIIILVNIDIKKELTAYIKN